MGKKLVYEWGGNAERDAPLYILVHGRAGNLSVMKIFKRVLPSDAHLLFIEAPQPDELGGFSWWNMESAESPVQHVDTLISTIEALIEEKELTPVTTTALGFSQGAAMLSMVAQRRPDLFSRIAMLAGFAVPLDDGAALVPEKHNEVPDVLMIHGTADDRIDFMKALESEEFLVEQGFEVIFYAEEGVGHKIGSKGMRVLKEWIEHQ